MQEYIHAGRGSAENKHDNLKIEVARQMRLDRNSIDRNRQRSRDETNRKRATIRIVTRICRPTKIASRVGARCVDGPFHQS